MKQEYLITPSVNPTIFTLNFSAVGLSIFNPTPYSVYIAIGTKIPHALSYDYIVLPGQYINILISGSIQYTISNSIVSVYLQGAKIQIIFYDENEYINPVISNSLIPPKPISYHYHQYTQIISPSVIDLTVLLVPFDRIAKIKFFSFISPSTSINLTFQLDVDNNAIYRGTMATPVQDRFIPMDINISPNREIGLLIQYITGASVDVFFNTFIELYSQ